MRRWWGLTVHSRAGCLCEKQLGGVRRQGWRCGGGDTFEDGDKLLVFKTYKEVKPHSSEESEDKVVEGERNKYDND